MKYSVVAGNIGEVYSGNSYWESICAFSDHVFWSKNDYRRVGGTSVSFFIDGELESEFVGSLETEKENWK